MDIPVIIVDDEKFDRYCAKRVLGKIIENGSITEFRAGDEFVAHLEQHGAKEFSHKPPPKVLVLLDINMPRMTGFEVLERLKALYETDEIHAECMIAMMYSSSDSQEDKERAFAYPFVKDFITKPLDMDQLERLISRYEQSNDHPKAA